MNINIRCVRESEYNGWRIGELSINPPYAYSDREFWYDYLECKLMVSSIPNAIRTLRKTPQTSSLYNYLSDRLYDKILTKLDNLENK